MEKRYAVEAKSFSFSAIAGKTELHLEERRKGFVGSSFMSLHCSNWLVDTVEAALLSPGEENFAKSFRENGKALMVHKGWNKSGCFLVADVFVEGGGEGVFGSLRVVKVGAGDASWESYENVWGFSQQRRGRWSLVSTPAGFFFLYESVPIRLCSPCRLVV